MDRLLLSFLFRPTSTGGLFVQGGLYGRKVDFVRCTGCGHDMRLTVDGSDVGNTQDHAVVRELLVILGQAVNEEAFVRLQQQVEEATWMRGYARPLVLPTAADVEQHGRGTPISRVVYAALTLGGDHR